MGNRHKDFNDLVALQFEEIGFAQEYISNLINDEEMTIEDALRETIISMGLKPFSEKAGISIQYVSDFVKKRKKFSTKSINKYLEKAFSLRIKMSVEAIDKNAA